MPDYEGVELVAWTPSYKAPPKPPREPQKRGRPTNASKGLPLRGVSRNRLTRSEMRDDSRAVFRAGLTEWLEADTCPLFSLQEVGESAYLADFKPGLNKRGRPSQQKTIPAKEWSRLASLLPGRVSPMPDNDGCTWQRGGGGSRGWLLTSQANLRAVLGAQAVLEDTIPAEDREGLLMPFTLGALARFMLRWTGLRQHCFKDTEKHLRHPDGYAFRRAVPGIYPERYVYWDAAAYYYTLISKLPSPLVSVSRKGVRFQHIGPQERERWDAIIAAIGGSKGLRNTLIGAMQGSRKELVGYSKNFPGGFIVYSQPGPLRETGLLVVRAGHELTQLENIGNGSIWGHTDCAVLPAGVEPSVWPSKGIVVAQKAAGDAHIIDQMSYRVGPRRAGVYSLWVNKDGTPKEGMMPYYDAENETEVQPGDAAAGTSFPEVQYHRFFL